MSDKKIIIPDFVNKKSQQKEKIKIRNKMAMRLAFYNIDLFVIAQALRKLLNKIENLNPKTDVFGYIDMLECIDVDNMNNPYPDDIPHELLYNKYTDIIMDLGLTMADAVYIQEKYSKAPIFTKAQLEATKGQASMLWEMERNKVMQEVTVKIQVLLDKLLDFILYIMGISSSNDDLATEIVSRYIPSGDISHIDILKSYIELANDGSDYRQHFVWDDNEDDE